MRIGRVHLELNARREYQLLCVCITNANEIKLKLTRKAETACIITFHLYPTRIERFEIKIIKNYILDIREM